MSLKDFAKGRADIFAILPSDIHVDPDLNIRFQGSEREARIEHLMASIKAKGIETPLKVRLKDDKVFVVSGHTRLEAVRRINEAEPGRIATLPCIAEKRNTTDAQRSMSLFSDNDSEPLGPLEKSALFLRQINLYGWTEQQIADDTGLSVKQVQNLLELSTATDAVKEIVSTDAIAATEAIKVIKKVGPDKATPIIEAAVAEAKSQGKTKATAKHVDKVMEAAKPAKPAANASRFGEQSDLRDAAPKPVAPPATKPTKLGLASDLLGMSSPASGSTVPAPGPVPPPVATPAPRAAAGVVAVNRALLEAMREILNLDDVTVIHTVVRDTLFEHDAETRAA